MTTEQHLFDQMRAMSDAEFLDAAVHLLHEDVSHHALVPEMIRRLAGGKMPCKCPVCGCELCQGEREVELEVESLDKRILAWWLNQEPADRHNYVFRVRIANEALMEQFPTYGDLREIGDALVRLGFECLEGTRPHPEEPGTTVRFPMYKPSEALKNAPRVAR